MKRTCNKCKALRLKNQKFYCELGYEVGQVTIYDALVTGRPLEECPKPLTNKAYDSLIVEY